MLIELPHRDIHTHHAELPLPSPLLGSAFVGPGVDSDHVAKRKWSFDDVVSNVYPLNARHWGAILSLDSITVAQQQTALLHIRVIDQIDNAIPVQAAWHVSMHHPDLTDGGFQLGGDWKLPDLFQKFTAERRRRLTPPVKARGLELQRLFKGGCRWVAILIELEDEGLMVSDDWLEPTLT